MGNHLSIGARHTNYISDGDNSNVLGSNSLNDDALFKQRQGSIRSELFTSRNNSNRNKIYSELAARNNLTTINSSNTNVKESLFKKDYSMGRHPNTVNHVKNRVDFTRNSSNEYSSSSLSSNTDSAYTPSFFSLGPSTATVEQSTEKVIRLDEQHHPHQNLASKKDIVINHEHRPSILALKQNLYESSSGVPLYDSQPSSEVPSELHSPSTRSFERQKSVSIDIPQDNSNKKDLRNPILINLEYNERNNKNESNFQNEIQPNNLNVNYNNNGNSNNYSADEDMVWNQSLLNGLITSNNDYIDNNINNKNFNLNHHKYPKFENSISPTFNDSNDGNVHYDGKQHCSGTEGYHFSDKKTSNIVNRTQFSSLASKQISYRNSSAFSSTFSLDLGSENVRVFLKWRDLIDDIENANISIVSNEILSVICMNDLDSENSDSARMVYYPDTSEWVTKYLFLPPGIYKLQFNVNGSLRHSDYLPTATDNLGNIVNWFEVPRGYESIEPFRDNDYVKNEISGGILQPIPNTLGIPSVSSQLSSFSFHASRPTTPYSDFAGINRSSPLPLREKSPDVKSTNFDLEFSTAVPEPKYDYTTEIPEIYKAVDLDLTTAKATETTTDDEDITKPPLYLGTGGNSIFNDVIGCSQRDLFEKLSKNTGKGLNTDELEKIFLAKYPITDLPIYLNTDYMNKALEQHRNIVGVDDVMQEEINVVNHIVPHVNIKHLLTHNIQDSVIAVACTVRYGGKFITQVVYSPCSVENDD
ncbi:hypothetical protein Kpol_1004p21 [Vanderwaltozyma polyspora DSM 70294]|uniref:Association with the SNF1 complex (ASC) domain-containing protein n=1 Tax=Vanderwaltozyma polyspora (strain ATCC 22028 / DSM 70294 / BCRC 21397 / CBS 2163 / NBRC 10782 / NRRL Y-8283 / UCD 57-17) TaxID=436907 RepID=A7TJ78_VANPO|nr:uncharacterized protein Kpol_1004p21 [Vanderwaltozyma polyspora DSM 70294]EDO17647.1 hypothetical protein Kpol_1004p21 [Vanderwaltozyma polyspora DSM 70294]